MAVKPSPSRRSEMLSAKFTEQERKSYDWLLNCQIGPWLVDHITKQVTTPEGVYPNLVMYAKHHGMT